MRLKHSIVCLMLLCTLQVLSVIGAHASRRVANVTFDEPQSLLAEARQDARDGRIEEAIKLYRRALALVPSSVEARRELAALLARRAETRAEAETLYREAVALEPRSAGLAIERADNLAAAGDAVNAILEYRRAFELEPENESALRAFIKQTARIGGAPAAIERAQKKIGETPDDLAVHLLLAELLRSEGRLNGAREQFLRARRISPDSVAALRGTVRVCLAADDLECAARQLKQLAAHLSNAQADAEYARLLLASGRPDAALQLLAGNKADRAQATMDATTLDVLADCYRARGEKQNERAALEKLLGLPEAERERTLERLARVHFELGESDAARTTIEQLLLIDAHNATGVLGLSLLKGSEANGAATVTASLEHSPPRQESSLAETPGQSDQPQQNLAARRAARERDEGEAALFWQQPARAIAPLLSALTVWPSSPRLHLALGQALQQTGQADKAIDEFINFTLEAGERRADALLLLAQAHESLRAPQRAIDIYDYILTRDTNNLPALLGQARAFEQLNRTGRVAALLSDLNRRAPEERSIQARLEAAFAALGRPLNVVSRSSMNPASSQRRPIETASPSQLSGLLPNALSELLLDIGDVLRVKIGGRDSGALMKIDRNGRLQFAVTKTALNARCRTESELESLIAQQLKRSSSSDISVEAVEFQSAPLRVTGAVSRPNDFYIKTPLDLPHSLMLPGGAGESAAGTLFVLRAAYTCPDDSSRVTLSEKRGAKIEVYNRQAAESGTPDSIPSLGAGDLLYVSFNNTAFIAGEVVKPAAVYTDGDLTLLKAVKQLGGTTTTARAERIRLLRLLPDKRSYQEFILNLNEIEQQYIGDIVLRSGDIVEVPSSVANNERMSALAQLLRRLSVNSPTPTSVPNVSGERQ